MKTILSLLYCKLTTEQNETAEEWMGQLRIKTSKLAYTEKDRSLKKQCIIGINNDEIMTEIIRELIAAQETSKITSDHVLA